MVNRVDPHMSRYQENLATLKAMLPAPFLGEIPFVDQPLEADLRDCLDISSLL
ncbi:dithiobiotin synthetase [compost metagenome]